MVKDEVVSDLQVGFAPVHTPLVWGRALDAKCQFFFFGLNSLFWGSVAVFWSGKFRSCQIHPPATWHCLGTCVEGWLSSWGPFQPQCLTVQPHTNASAAQAALLSCPGLQEKASWRLPVGLLGRGGVQEPAGPLQLPGGQQGINGHHWVSGGTSCTVQGVIMNDQRN